MSITLKEYALQATYQGKQIKIVKHNVNAMYPYVIITAGLGIKIDLNPSQVARVLELEDGRMTQVKEDNNLAWWFCSRKGNVLTFNYGDERLKVKVNRTKLV